MSKSVKLEFKFLQDITLIYPLILIYFLTKFMSRDFLNYKIQTCIKATYNAILQDITLLAILKVTASVKSCSLGMRHQVTVCPASEGKGPSASQAFPPSVCSFLGESS